jgi:hypothetical protein
LRSDKLAGSEVETLEDGSTSIRSARGSVLVTSLAADVFLYRFEGHLATDMFQPSMVLAHHALKSNATIVLLGDGEVWQSYEPGYRNAWTVWFARHRRQVREAHLFSQSSIVRMGAQVINMALGVSILHIYKRRLEFERAVARVSKTSIGVAPTR